MREAFAILIFLFISSAYAQNSCVMLEGLNLGCVSSVDHSCVLNKKVDETKSPCRYVGSPDVQWRVEAPIAFHCKSSRQTVTCYPQVCNADGCVSPPCTTASECTEYQPPSCAETCIKCFQEVVNVNVGLAKGCIVCTRKSCADEPPVVPICPATYNGLVHYSGEKCSSDSKCPTTAVDPLGKTHPVTIYKGSCPSGEMPQPPPPIPPPMDCPWKVDQRTATGCERIKCDNRNPEAEPGCVDP